MYFSYLLAICLVGSYANETGLSSCRICPAGFECAATTIFPLPCTQGYYCHIGNDPTFSGLKQACPAGTFGATAGLSQISQCSKCSGGKYCDGITRSNVTGSCDAGYFCRENATSQQPEDDIQNPKRFGRCPPGGYFCVQGSISPQPCPPGTYAPGGKSTLKQESDCDPCLAGSYCAAGNQTVVSGPCLAGYYCNKGSPDMAPTNITHGGICPPGTRCPTGSSVPIPCVAGTYNNMSGQASCTVCPNGFYCPANSTYPIDCPSGYWCEQGATVADTNACPAGYFNNLTRRYLRSHCQECTPGYYCALQGIYSSIFEMIFMYVAKSYLRNFQETTSL